MAAQPLPQTKVVATLGPASEPRLGELVAAGLSVARVNFSHGTPEDHRRRAARVREEAERHGRAVALLADLEGPKLRLGRLAGGERTLQEGELVRIVETDRADDPAVLPFAFGGFLRALAPGQRLVLADGLVELECTRVRESEAQARVVRAGTISDRKGVHFPDTDLDFEIPTESDRRALALARQIEVDLIGVSFVARPQELQAVRELAPEAALVAKIERKAALSNLDALLDEADGLMVARGDLGVEIELEEVPIVQKRLLAESARRGLFTITATEMLESMVDSSRPTRAEVADVANAILDGTDAVMLSAETAVGRYPLEAVETMLRIARAVEASTAFRTRPRPEFRPGDHDVPDAIALAAVRAAEALAIPRIVCFTESGNTARLVSRYRPRAEVIALSPDPRTVRRMAVLACVLPLPFAQRSSIEQMLGDADRMLLERGLARRGDEIVFVAGAPPGLRRSTNLIQHHRIGEPVRLR